MTLKVTLEPIGPDFLQLRVRAGHRVGNRLSRSIESRQISLTGQRMGYVADMCPIHGPESKRESESVHGELVRLFSAFVYRGDE